MKTNDVKSIDQKLYYFDQDAAEYAVRFFGLLRHAKGRWAGQAFALQPWQDYIVRQLFGWKRYVDGMRMYRKAFIEVPRKAGKSTLAAGLALLLSFADGEPGAEVYSLAADKQQAHIVFDTAKAMVQSSPVLTERVEPFRTAIVQAQSGSSYRVLSSDSKTKAGFNPHGVVIDELYALDDRELVDLMTTAVGARTQPMIIYITTAGFDQESLCFETYDYARRVTDGIVTDPTFFAAIYEADQSDDWTNPLTWKKAQPSLGVTVTEEFLREECRKAQEMPSYQNTFRRLYLNQWTQQSTRWIDLGDWDACVGDVHEDPEGRTGFFGVDLAKSTDIAAVALVLGPSPAFPKYSVLPMFFIPEDNIRTRSSRDHVPFELWVKQGYIIATPGNICDYDFIKAWMDARREETRVSDVLADPWNASQFVTSLSKDGWNVVEARQGYKTMSPTCKEFLRLLMSRGIELPRNPVLRWMADNVDVVSDPAENIKPVKRSATARIDGIVAILDALYGHIQAGGQDDSDYYATHDIVSL